MERAVALARFEEVTVEDLPPAIRDHEPASLGVGGSDPRALVPLEPDGATGPG